MVKTKRKLSYKVDVLTQKWDIYYLSKSEFIKKYGDHTIAIAECDEREIFVRIDKIRKYLVAKESIAHELGHAYFHESGSTVMQISVEQTEELCCDIIAKYGIRINEQASAILNAYNVIRGHKIK